MHLLSRSIERGLVIDEYMYVADELNSERTKKWKRRSTDAAGDWISASVRVPLFYMKSL